jgi:UDP-N-acetylglucosamine 1-carboxyvinyltransferase
MLLVEGGQTLSGTVSISGSKNAALPLIGAALFFKKTVLRNVPDISDVHTLVAIAKSVGAKAEFRDHVLTIEAGNMDASGMDLALVKKIRASILLVPAFLRAFGSVELPYPGGCNIGKRPIDVFVNGFFHIGYSGKFSDSGVELSGLPKEGDVEFSAGFAVTATESLILANVLRKGKTKIFLSAIEPHVVCLVDFLNAHGAKIHMAYDHTIEIDGVSALAEEAEFDVISDYIESGTFVVAAALAAKDFVDIQNARIADLRAFLSKCADVGVRYEVLSNDTLRVYRSVDSLKAVRVQTNVFPGFPTDLQSPFVILLTQAEGVSKIEEIVYESRLNWLIEIEKMKGHPAILNPNAALIFGRTHLRGATVSSWDLRAGVAMILAGLIAEGETRITNVEYIERGYEDIVAKFRSLGANIQKIDSVS